MKELMEKWEGTPFPEMLRGLPEVDIPFEGVRGWLLQGERTQAAFFDIEAVGRIPPHSHGAQWGIMIEGEMELTIDGVTHHIKKGDWYYIPAGATHSATFKRRVQVIDIFDEPNRYNAK